MSYNITSTQVIHNDGLAISCEDFDRLAKDEDGVPECCFLTEDLQRTGGNIKLKNLNWYGDGSRTWRDFFPEKVAPCLRGSAIVLVVWEGGDRVELVRIHEGKVETFDLLKTFKKHPLLLKMLLE